MAKLEAGPPVVSQDEGAVSPTERRDEVFEIMRGFLAFPLDSTPEQLERIRQVWEEATLEGR